MEHRKPASGGGVLAERPCLVSRDVAIEAVGKQYEGRRLREPGGLGPARDDGGA
jgi:hypothetical protein